MREAPAAIVQVENHALGCDAQPFGQIGSRKGRFQDVHIQLAPLNRGQLHDRPPFGWNPVQLPAHDLGDAAGREALGSMIRADEIQSAHAFRERPNYLHQEKNVPLSLLLQVLNYSGPGAAGAKYRLA